MVFLRANEFGRIRSVVAVRDSNTNDCFRCWTQDLTKHRSASAELKTLRSIGAAKTPTSRGHESFLVLCNSVMCSQASLRHILRKIQSYRKWIRKNRQIFIFCVWPLRICLRIGPVRQGHRLHFIRAHRLHMNCSVLFVLSSAFGVDGRWKP